MCIRSSMKYKWHSFWLYYNKMLYDSCLDEEMKTKLLKKARYHERFLKD